MRINRETCTGCGYCLLICPFDAIRSDGWAAIEDEACTDCNLCAFACPNDCFVPEVPVEARQAEYGDHYDVAVIGAGIGGLMTAAWLAREGRQVGIFEKLSFIGGRYTEIDHHGYAVTTAAWTSLGQKCNIGRFLKDVGAQVDYITLKDKGRDGKMPEQGMIQFKDGRRYAELRQMLSPEEWRGFLKALIEGRKKATNDVSTREYVERYIQNDDLIAVIDATVGTASGLKAETMPASEYIQIIMDMRAAGRDFAFPVGGVRSIIRALERVITDHGGEIFTCAQVGRIVVQDGQAKGVVLANGDEVSAEIVVHNAGARKLIKLVSKGNLPASYVKRIAELVPMDCAALILGTTEPLLTEVPILTTPGCERVVGIFGPTFFDPSVAPSGRHMVDVFFPLHSYDRQRELELAMDDLHALFPHLDEVLDITIPMFFAGLWTGAETVQTFGQVGGQRLDPRTPIENLFLVGMDAVGSGVAGDLIPLGVRRLLGYLS